MWNRTDEHACTDENISLIAHFWQPAGLRAVRARAWRALAHATHVRSRCGPRGIHAEYKLPTVVGTRMPYEQLLLLAFRRARDVENIWHMG